MRLKSGVSDEGLREIDRAFARGRISWSVVRELKRMATPETESEWVSFAEESSLRKIEQTVARTPGGDAGSSTRVGSITASPRKS